jgi:hypothetical protein
MADPYLFSVTNYVATFSLNSPPRNLMSLEYIDQLEELQLPYKLTQASLLDENSVVRRAPVPAHPIASAPGGSAVVSAARSR